MKLSMFNSKVEYLENSFLYNSFSNIFILVDSTIAELFNSIVDYEGIAELESYHKSFYESLLLNGFIVDDNCNEVDKVKALSKKVDEDNSTFHLIINPTMNCNFKCWYCYESHIKGSKMNSSTVENVCSLINNVIIGNEELKMFKISWFGGEPLMYYRDVIKPIMKYAKSVCIESNIKLEFEFTTNGFLFTDEIIDELKPYPISGFQITLDGSEEFHDKVRFVSESRGSYKTILENVTKLTENGMRVALRVNYTDINLVGFESVVNDLNKLNKMCKSNLSVAFHKVWQITQTREMLNRVEVLINSISSIGILTAEGAIPDNVKNSCYADKINSATINYNGDVFKCTARVFGSSSKEGILNENGKIDWNEKHNKRMNIKFQNKPCLECAILPICNGGCSQHALENIGKDYCEYGFDESAKKDVIVQKLINYINA